jgi:hypothetical protein
MENRGSNG